MPENLNRREFVRALGITGAGLALTAASAVAAPGKVLAATDGESKPGVMPQRYWWVKNVDKPTTEVDWKVMKRFNEWETTRGSLGKYRGEMFGPQFDKQLAQNSKDNMKRWETEGKPGYTTKDMALQAAVGAAKAPLKFMGPQSASTPEDRGVPKYKGTPEENARIVRVALRHMGAATVGFVELNDETTKKLIYAQQPAPKKQMITFEDIDVGYEKPDKFVIPNKARYAIVYTVQMSTETMKYGPTILGSLTTSLSYTKLYNIYTQLHEFIRSLGYNSYGSDVINGLGIAPAMAVMAGLGELSRLNRLITPEYGPMVREAFLLTDLPVAPTKPINFGVMEFCKTCKRCAQMCPSKSLSMDTLPSWEVKGKWNNPGHRAYFENSVTCRNYWQQVGTNCGICFSVCPYAASDDASIHKIWQATASMTPAINGIIAEGNRAAYPDELGKPMKNPEDWWKNENQAEQGIDTRRGGRNI